MDARFTPSPLRASITSISLEPDALAQGHLEFHVSFVAPQPLAPPIVGITIYNKLGQPLCGANTRMADARWAAGPAKSGTVIARIDSAPLRSDSYRASVWLGDADRDYDVKLDALVFDFVSSRFDPKAPSNEVLGPIDLPWQWRFSESVRAEAS
jgi:lipopolysaccharide transport system ATP-binding protein